jgi:predicted nucleotidyltransferase
MTIGSEHSAAWRDPGPVIEEMVRRIAERFHPERIILFGSHAKGAGRSDG